MAGYSGTPLPIKLGIKPGHRVALVAAPTGIAAALRPMPERVEVCHALRGSRPFDVFVLFADRRQALPDRFAAAAHRLASAGGLWVAWPKKSSGVPTDLGENEIREVGLDAGLVDNKVCAIDETWSGLRFVRRLKDRPHRGESIAPAS